MKRFLAVFSTTEMRNIIASIYTFGCFLFLILLVFVRVPAENKELVNIITPLIIGGEGIVLSYFFGASKKDITTETNTTTTK